MIASRMVSRAAAPRAVSRLTNSVTRRTVASQLLVAHQPTPASLRCFSVSSMVRSTQPATRSLLTNIDNELAMEKEMAQSEGTAERPVVIEEFLRNSEFQLETADGKDEVKLVRQYGDEKITVLFSVTDVSAQEDYVPDEDEAFTDEDPESNENAEEEEDEAALAPQHVTIVVEKPGKSAGALNIDATAQENTFVIDGLFYYPKVEQALAASSEAVHSRGEIYSGPSFHTLDESLQTGLEGYLEERGINSAMAVFIPEFIAWKEQKEYINWLNSVRSFISA